MNQCTFMGRLAREPELRYTQQGTPVTTFSIAVPRPKQAGKEAKTDFFNVVTWRGQAEFASKYLRKGRRIVIIGEMRNRDYTDKDGNKRWATELNADKIFFADNKEDGAASRPADYAEPGSFTQIDDDDDELPFRQ